MSWEIQDPADALLDRERWEATRRRALDAREREASMNEDDCVGRDEE